MAKFFQNNYFKIKIFNFALEEWFENGIQNFFTICKNKKFLEILNIYLKYLLS